MTVSISIFLKNGIVWIKKSAKWPLKVENNDKYLIMIRTHNSLLVPPPERF